MRQLILCSLTAALLLSGCAQFGDCSADPQCVRVLFIGNSYTFVNDLPATLTNLAQAGGQRLETGMLADGGWTLAQHVASSATLDKINSSKWNFVVLQEQSQIPASQPAREAGMFPAARTLAIKIKAVGATPVLFVTWGHRAGWPENGQPDYQAMQLQINGGYLTLGQELKLPLSPVGYAWLAMSRQYPQINLWQEDGSHPNEQGTYLAACVFYTAIFQKSSEGLSYIGNVSKDNAAIIQKIASDTVLNDRKKWILPDLGQK